MTLKPYWDVLWILINHSCWLAGEASFEPGKVFLRGNAMQQQA